VRELIATWNPSRDVWETEQGDLFSEHSVVFSGIWPRSGMTRAGVAYELAMWVPPIVGSASSSSPGLPTPAAHDAQSTSPSQAERHSPGLDALPVLLPTPEAKLADSGPDYARAKREGSGGDDLTTALFRLTTDRPR
jgi:hypothetical protein